MDGKEFFKFLAGLICFVALFCAIVSSIEKEAKIKTIRKINKYEIVELEDGHQYLRSHKIYSDNLIHYVECEKCKRTK